MACVLGDNLLRRLQVDGGPEKGIYEEIKQYVYPILQGKDKNKTYNLYYVVNFMHIFASKYDILTKKAGKERNRTPFSFDLVSNPVADAFLECYKVVLVHEKQLATTVKDPLTTEKRAHVMMFRFIADSDFPRVFNLGDLLLIRLKTLSSDRQADVSHIAFEIYKKMWSAFNVPVSTVKLPSVDHVARFIHVLVYALRFGLFSGHIFELSEKMKYAFQPARGGLTNSKAVGKYDRSSVARLFSLFLGELAELCKKSKGDDHVALLYVNFKWHYAVFLEDFRPDSTDGRLENFNTIHEQHSESQDIITAVERFELFYKTLKHMKVARRIEKVTLDSDFGKKAQLCLDSMVVCHRTYSNRPWKQCKIFLELIVDFTQQCFKAEDKCFTEFAKCLAAPVAKVLWKLMTRIADCLLDESKKLKIRLDGKEKIKESEREGFELLMHRCRTHYSRLIHHIIRFVRNHWLNAVFGTMVEDDIDIACEELTGSTKHIKEWASSSTDVLKLSRVEQFQIGDAIFSLGKYYAQKSTADKAVKLFRFGADCMKDAIEHDAKLMAKSAKWIYNKFEYFADVLRQFEKYSEGMEYLVLGLKAHRQSLPAAAVIWVKLQSAMHAASPEKVKSLTKTILSEEKDFDPLEVLICEFEACRELRDRSAPVMYEVTKELLKLEKSPNDRPYYMMEHLQARWQCNITEGEKSIRDTCVEAIELLEKIPVKKRHPAFNDDMAKCYFMYYISGDIDAEEINRIVAESEALQDLSNQKTQERKTFGKSCNIHQETEVLSSILMALSYWQKCYPQGTLRCKNSTLGSLSCIAAIYRLSGNKAKELESLQLMAALAKRDKVITAYITAQTHIVQLYCQLNQIHIAQDIIEATHQVAPETDGTVTTATKAQPVLEFLITKADVMVLHGKIQDARDLLEEIDEKKKSHFKHNCKEGLILNSLMNEVMAKIRLDPDPELLTSPQQGTPADLQVTSARVLNKIVVYMLGESLLLKSDHQQERPSIPGNLNSTQKWHMLSKLLSSMYSAGMYLTQIGDWREAKCYLLQGLKLTQAFHLPKRIATFHLALAELHHLMGRVEDCQSHLNDVKRILKINASPNQIYNPSKQKHSKYPSHHSKTCFQLDTTEEAKEDPVEEEEDDFLKTKPMDIDDDDDSGSPDEEETMDSILTKNRKNLVPESWLHKQTCTCEDCKDFVLQELCLSYLLKESLCFQESGKQRLVTQNVSTLLKYLDRISNRTNTALEKLETPLCSSSESKSKQIASKPFNTCMFQGTVLRLSSFLSNIGVIENQALFEEWSEKGLAVLNGDNDNPLVLEDGHFWAELQYLQNVRDLPWMTESDDINKLSETLGGMVLEGAPTAEEKEGVMDLGSEVTPEKKIEEEKSEDIQSQVTPEKETKVKATRGRKKSSTQKQEKAPSGGYKDIYMDTGGEKIVMPQVNKVRKTRARIQKMSVEPDSLSEDEGKDVATEGKTAQKENGTRGRKKSSKTRANSGTGKKTQADKENSVTSRRKKTVDPDVAFPSPLLLKDLNSDGKKLSGRQQNKQKSSAQEDGSCNEDPSLPAQRLFGTATVYDFDESGDSDNCIVVKKGRNKSARGRKTSRASRTSSRQSVQEITRGQSTPVNELRFPAFSQDTMSPIEECNSSFSSPSMGSDSVFYSVENEVSSIPDEQDGFCDENAEFVDYGDNEVEQPRGDDDVEVPRKVTLKSKKRVKKIYKHADPVKDSTPVTKEEAVAHRKENLQRLKTNLTAAFDAIKQAPPVITYRNICHGLALLTLQEPNPMETLYYMTEAQGVTFRHSALINLSRIDRLIVRNGITTADDEAYRTRMNTFYRNLSFDKNPAYLKTILKSLPTGVIVCKIGVIQTVTHPSGEMVMFRLSSDSGITMVPLPGFKTSAGQKIITEFADIMKHTKESMCISDKYEWWDTRKELDERLKNLLAECEQVWFGEMRFLLWGLPSSEELLNKLNAIASSIYKTCPIVSLEHIRMLLYSGNALTEQELVKALGQLAFFNGSDTCCLAFQTCAKEIFNQAKEFKLQHSDRKPVVLILDRLIQHLPFESLPILYQHPVTRMQSLYYLSAIHTALKQDAESVYLTGVESKNTFYVLNPDDNLKGTQERFQSLFEKTKGWKGITGKSPTSAEFKEAITQNDLFIYCGHGSGSKYLSGEALQSVRCRAVALLMGCSSGKLDVMGKMDAYGMVQHYSFAGCPAIVSALWDVTDKDIDRYLSKLLTLWFPGKIKQGLEDCIPLAREYCKLPYLIGSSVIMYGLPIVLKRKELK